MSSFVTVFVTMPSQTKNLSRRGAKKPAMTCDHLILNLLAQVGGYQELQSRRLAYHFRSGKHLPIKERWLKTRVVSRAWQVASL